MRQEEYKTLAKPAAAELILCPTLNHLRQEGHKILIFSQFVKVLNVLEDYVKRKVPF